MDRERPRTRRVSLESLAFLGGVIPLLLLLIDSLTGGLGADPVESLLLRTGWWALTLLIATLAITPLRRLTGWNRVIQLRRPLGLLAFGYGVLHFLVYLALDQWFALAYIKEDLLERPFITAGFTSLLLLTPLAATSTREAIRRLGGRRWRRLHRGVYPAAVLGVLHFFGMVKADLSRPLLYALLLGFAFALRLPFGRRHAARSAALPER